MKRFFATMPVAAIGLIAGVLCACARAPVEAGAPPADPSVAAARVVRADFTQNVELTGEFIPYQEVDVMAKVSGYVREMNVDMGDQVRRGDPLATLEIPEMQDQMHAAAASVETAQQDVAAARDQLQREQAAAHIAHLSFTRIQDVIAKNPGLVPQQDVDVAHSTDLEAQAQLAAAQAALQAAESRAQQAVDEQARLGTLYRYADITAPFSGVVTKRYANVGTLIQAGTSSSTQAMPLVRLAQEDLLRLILPVPVTAVPRIHLGEPVAVNVVTLGERFPGRVVRFAHEVKTDTRTMDTEVDVPNPHLALMPGIYAEVELQLQAHSRVLSVPLDAVVGMGGAAQPYVFEVGQDRRLVKVSVQPGLQSPTAVEVTGPLAAGDVVVVGRQSGLVAGERVQAVFGPYDNAHSVAEVR